MAATPIYPGWKPQDKLMTAMYFAEGLDMIPRILTLYLKVDGEALVIVGGQLTISDHAFSLLLPGLGTKFSAIPGKVRIDMNYGVGLKTYNGAAGLKFVDTFRIQANQLLVDTNVPLTHYEGLLIDIDLSTMFFLDNPKGTKILSVMAITPKANLPLTIANTNVSLGVGDGLQVINNALTLKTSTAAFTQSPTLALVDKTALDWEGQGISPIYYRRDIAQMEMWTHPNNFVPSSHLYLSTEYFPRTYLYTAKNNTLTYKTASGTVGTTPCQLILARCGLMMACQVSIDDLQVAANFPISFYLRQQDLDKLPDDPYPFVESTVPFVQGVMKGQAYVITSVTNQQQQYRYMAYTEIGNYSSQMYLNVFIPNPVNQVVGSSIKIVFGTLVGYCRQDRGSFWPPNNVYID
ncbi:fiber 1 [White sturgeon adenovirus 1]|uniref:Fiber 1 n=1 Tax=White sturgeon adenovirus 1 TaxID=2580388 RepID=A0A4P8PQU1_9ADEN|nr:fiber 1 [White sturgeon adenovirus 1]QCQ84145.1 fiber 1 [White sturgeon adenovirus 1]